MGEMLGVGIGPVLDRRSSGSFREKVRQMAGLHVTGFLVTLIANGENCELGTQIRPSVWAQMGEILLICTSEGECWAFHCTRQTEFFQLVNELGLESANLGFRFSAELAFMLGRMADSDWCVDYREDQTS